MSRTIKIAIEGPHTAFVSGYEIRDVITELKGRPPVWAQKERAWCVSEATAMDVLAICEQRNWNIVLTGSAEASGMVEKAWRDLRNDETSVSKTGTHVIEQPDPGDGLW